MRTTLEHEEKENKRQDQNNNIKKRNKLVTMTSKLVNVIVIIPDYLMNQMTKMNVIARNTFGMEKM